MARSKKFDEKTFRGERITETPRGCVQIVRVWIWCKGENRYIAPVRGARYEAIRYEAAKTGGKKRRKAGFGDLSEARTWQQGVSKEGLTPSDASVGKHFGPLVAETPAGPTFSEVVEEFRKRKYARKAIGTQEHYDQLFRLHFQSLMAIPVRDITPRVIDTWLADLKASIGSCYQSKQRKGFEKELTLLGVVLRYHDEYGDDPSFRFPVKKRHREDCFVSNVHESKEDRGLTEDELKRIVAEAKLGADGRIIAALIQVQFRQALRISEAAALRWENVSLNFKDPSSSSLRICEHVEWSRVKDRPHRVGPGFKNSKTAGGSKESPLMHESFEALKSLFRIGAKGLVFPSSSGAPFSYRAIQHRYELAFRGASIHFKGKGTHSLRHGGCRAVYNATKDLALAGQLLGNEDSDTVKVYARRDKDALQKYTKERWAKSEERKEGALHELAREKEQA